MKRLLTLICLSSTMSLFAQKQITVEDIYEKGVFKEESIASLNWMNDGLYYTVLEENKIIRYNVTTGLSDSVILDAKKYGLVLDDYEFSADEKHLILMTDKKSVYRRSYTAEHYIYTFKGEVLKKLSEGGRQSYATFSPDNSKVGFVRDNNLFYTKLVNMSEYAVTTDGVFGQIINGSSDWVYEEELYLTKAFYWSPDGKKLAYYRFDESKVKEYNMQIWNPGSLYPTDYRFKYPKAGEDNSIVDILIFHLETNKTVKVDFGKNKDFYVPKVQWTMDSNMLSVMTLNRLQNKIDISHASVTSGHLMSIFSDASKTYIDINEACELIYLQNGTHFILSSERKGYKHYYLHRTDGQLLYEITSGPYETFELVGIDQRTKNPDVYYISNEGANKDRALYKVGFNGKGKIKMSLKPGINRVDMSKDFKYYINFNQSAIQPLEVTLMSTKKAEVVKILKDNAQLKKTAEEYGLTKKIYFDLNAADKKQLNAYMLQPAKMDSTKKHPVLIYQYSGPGSQNVLNNWAGSHHYFHQLLTQKGYIIVVVDTRGTGGKGEAFKKMTYQQLGKLECEDLIASAIQLGELPFVDKNRIGIWGWSYGGYMSALTMMQSEGTFKTGIAVAPVTSWRFYDTIYTERYLRTPQENQLGYDENSPNTHAEKLKGSFLMIHGTGDDNVHFQNAITLQNRLIEAGKQFQSFYYPDRDHSIYGGNTRVHLYNMMTQFVINNL